jgi:hypothetical protein
MKDSNGNDSPRLLERLRSIYGSYGKFCRAIGVPDSYPNKWKRTGYIPEQWALDIHRLAVRDSEGQITAMTVLYEAEEARMRMIREAVAERGD